MLEQRQTPLLVEMQLYFSCVVKKRVLFHAHDTGDIEQTDEIVRVNDKLHVVFRAVQASSCDPVEFARHYPVKQEFRTRPALKMYPSRLKLDYPQDGWLGEFSI